MTTYTFTSFRTLIAVAVIGLAAVVGLAATTSTASALPRDANDLVTDCNKFGGWLTVQVTVKADGSIIGDYWCTYEFSYERCLLGNGSAVCYRDNNDGCTDLGGGEGFCVDPEPEPEPEPTAGEPANRFTIPMTNVSTYQLSRSTAGPTDYMGGNEAVGIYR